MNPTFRHYGLLSLAALFFASAYVRFCPELFMHGSFALWRAKAHLADGPPDYDLLVLGDSKPMFGILPRALGSPAVSLAIEGSSTIESYYLLRRYLKAHRPPRRVLYSVSPIRFQQDEYFWENTAKSDEFPASSLLEVLAKAHELGDYEFTEYSWGGCPFCGPLRALALKAGFAPLYQNNIAYGHVFGRGAANRALEATVVDGLGQIDAPVVPEKVSSVGREARYQEFHSSRVLAWYFDETLRLCEESHVPVTYVYVPTNPASLALIPGGFKAAFRAFLGERQGRFPGFSVAGDFAALDPSRFADQDHLNHGGAAEFSAGLARLVSGLKR